MSLHRRQFLQLGAAAIGSAAARTEHGIFDAHLHIPSDNGTNFQWHLITRTMPDFVRYLDRCGIQRGIISSSRGLIAATPDDYRAANREVARYAEQYRGRFRPSGLVTPFAIDEALGEIEHCRKQLGFLWFGEFCNYMGKEYDYRSPQWAEIMRLVAKLGAVIQIHSEGDETLYLAEKFPDTQIVFAHLGSGLKEITERIAIVAKHPNTAIDISGSGIERVGILEKAVAEIGPDRILFGSDFTINEPAGVIARVKNAEITEEQREKILFRNVEALLQRSEARL